VGGNFGVVTSFEFRLHPVGMILGGLIAFPLGRGGELFRAYRAWAAEVPDEFTTIAAVITAPPAPFVPPDLVGHKIAAVVGCWCGDPEEGRAALEPLRRLGPAVDAFAPMPYPVVQSMLDEGALAGRRNYVRSGYVSDLSDGLIEAVLDHGARMPSPFSQIHFYQLGGAVARVGEDDTAFSHRRAAYVFNANSTWVDPSEDEIHETANRELVNAIGPFSTGGVYVNFLGHEGEARIRAAYGDAKYERLARLKGAFDPQNLFRMNQNIPPSTTR
jgi:hypothetical protein